MEAIKAGIEFHCRRLGEEERLKRQGSCPSLLNFDCRLVPNLDFPDDKILASEAGWITNEKLRESLHLFFMFSW